MRDVGGDHERSARNVLDALPFAVWETDATGRITTVNTVFLGFAVGGEAVGSRLVDVLEPGLATFCTELTEDVLSTGVIAARRRGEDSGGSATATPVNVHEVEVRPRLTVTGRVVGSVGVLRDVSGRAAAERLTADHTAFQRLVMGLAVEFVNVPLEDLDTAIEEALARTGEFTRVARAYLFRYDFDTATTSNTHEWCAPGVAPMIDELQAVPMSAFPEWLETHLRGEVMHVPSVSSRPVDDDVRRLLEPQGVETLLAVPLTEGDRCLGFVGFDVVGEGKDWTQDELALLRVLAELFTNAQVRREREHALVEAKRTAELASTAKSRFLSVVSHELRTPMHGVLGMLELLADGVTSSEHRRYARAAEGSARALLALVDALLETARIEAGGVTLNSAPLELREVVEDVRALVTTQARDRPVRVTCRVDPRVPRWVVGDELRLRQVITNLAGNAVKFTDEGEVGVGVEVVGAGDGMVELRLEVADTGIGIDPEVLTEIFDPFVQAEDAPARRHDGAGLGLSIVRELVSAMGGSVSLDSDRGVGSRVVVDLALPVVDEGDEPDAGPVSAPGVARHVLVVEDNDVNREVARAHLEDLGCAVTVVGDGVAAVRQVADGGFDLVLMDCFMPVVDGFEATRRILRTDPDAPPVVAVTADATAEHARRCVSAGMCDVLVKPFSRDDVAVMLTRWAPVA